MYFNNKKENFKKEDHLVQISKNKMFTPLFTNYQQQKESLYLTKSTRYVQSLKNTKFYQIDF